MRKIKVLAFVTITALAGVAGCEDEPEPGTPSNTSPAAPPAVPLRLSGLVKDAAGAAIAGATVTLRRTGGAVAFTVTAGNDGAFSQDVGTESETALTAQASKAGYGSATRTVSLDKAQGLATVDTLVLDKLEATTQTVTPAGASMMAVPSPESDSGAGSLSVTIPPNAVSADVMLSVAAAPVTANPPISSTSQVILTEVVVDPSSVMFGQPVQYTLPLPVKATPGMLDLLRLDEATGGWTMVTEKATVAGSGLSASFSSTRAGTYAVLHDAQVMQSTARGLASAETRTVTLASASTSVDLPTSSMYSVTFTGNNAPSRAWTENYVSLLNSTRPGSSTIRFFLAFPGLPATYIRDGRQFNPDRPTESGSWAYVYTLESVMSSRTTTIAAPSGSWTASVVLARTTWRLASAQWVWSSASGSGSSGTG